MKLEREFQRDGLVFLGITNESADLVRGFFRKEGYAFTTLLDAKDDVADDYVFSSTPTIMFLGRHGQVLGRVIGMRSWDSPEGRTLIRHLLAVP